MKSPKPLLLIAALAAALALVAGCNNSTQPKAGPYSLITTWAGTGVPGLGGEGQAPNKTDLYWPADVNFGPDGRTYIADWNNHRIRVVDHGVTNTLIGTGQLGDAEAGQATDVSLNHPTQVSFDPQGHLILCAWHNSKIMTMDLSTGYIEPTCGTGARAYGGDGGPAIDADLNLPTAAVFDSFGRLIFIDQANQRLRFVENGIIDTYAGTGVKGYAGDGGLAKDAQFNLPVGQAAFPAGKIDIDSGDNVYVADTGNHRIRVIYSDEVLPGPGVRPSHETNTIDTVAGIGTPGFSGDGGPATDAQLYLPVDVAVGVDGDFFIADTYNHCIRHVDSDGIITTIAGQGGQKGYAGDGGNPTKALLNEPVGVAVDPNGNLFIADRANNRIRVVWRNP